jgi:hydroxyacylglutathione hydrolase
MITPIKLRLSNAYIVRGTQPILIDSGSPGEGRAIEAALAAQGLAVADLGLIMHTHVHADHVGSTAELLRIANVPTGYHAAEEPNMQRGTNGALNGIGLRGRIMARFMSNAAFTRFTPDVRLTEGLRLDAYGIAGVVVHTPGHTAGSVSLVLDSGAAIVGDLLMGGYIGGNLLPRRVQYHYFAERFELVQESLRRVLAYGPHTLYVGHGGPLSAAAVRAKWPQLTPLAVG